MPSAVLLDDHQVVLDGLAVALERGGFEVLACSTRPSEALDEVRRHTPDLFVCDWWLGQEQAAAHVAEARRLSPTTRVAVLTGHEDGSVAAAALNAGANGFLVKDALRQDLVQQLLQVASGQLVLDARVSEHVLSPAKYRLTPREEAVVIAIAAGRTNREIAAELMLSAHTVKEHVGNVMRKLGTTSRAQTAVVAMTAGLVPPTQSPVRGGLAGGRR
ncbi:MAG: LuxR family transcriptional regulator [Frankiales bacterium]|nr:LuxR family transcriptional regulator [Frankiales bacterium]